MELSEILNLILGGSLLASVAGVITLRATVRKANAEAERAKADADGVRITNTENATRILVENIVKPLKEELNATREDLQATKKEMASTKREMARLRKAVETASNCPHSDGCPVLARLRINQKDAERADSDSAGRGEAGYDRPHNKTESDGGDSGEPDADGDTDGQPP